MYVFKDIAASNAAETQALPTEAVNINGQYIEDAISGYRTLYTKGRETLAKEINSLSVGVADGESIKGFRYPAREIVVGFQIVASSASSFREMFNHLANILSQDESDFVFADEQDKFFTGIPIFDAEIEGGRNAVVGEWKIYCAYPFKRSVAVKEAVPSTINDTDAEFTIAYGGNYPAKPILRAEFAGALAGGDWSDDGDCGFVAWTDSDENIIQVGNTEAIELDTALTAGQVLNRTFTTIDGFSTTGGATWDSEAVTGSFFVNQTITDTYWNKGAGQSLKFVEPSYGSNSGWHGPIAYFDVQGGMVNYDIACVHRLAASANAQCGSFELGAYSIVNGVYTLLTGFLILKNSNGTSGTVKYIVNGVEVGSNNIDLSYYNTNFGYCKSTPIYKTQYYNKKTKKWQYKKRKKAKTRRVVSSYTYTQSNLNSSIKKAGDVVTFKVGNIAARTFTDADIADSAAHNISMHFGSNGTVAALHTNAVHSLKCTRKGGPLFTDYQNTFTSGDIVDADTNDATVTLYRAGSEAGEGMLVPQYGALGNDWEDFSLDPNSVNTIAVTWSPWVRPEYKPTLKILYNEVFI